MTYNAAVESFRDEEYPMMQGKVYLDHGGTTIYARSMIESFSSQLLYNLYGNPHSSSDPAQLSSQVIEATRQAALNFVAANPEHFDLIFTANATAAIKLVGESFRDLALHSSRTGTFFYGYHRDGHTSLVGIRELTTGTHHCFTSDAAVEQWLEGDGDQNILLTDGVPCLFAYPGQSNMTGRKLPLAWCNQLRQSTKAHHQNTYSLLDAAALATTSQLDFSDPETAPDFTALSFYKIFGFPDLGALIVRKSSGHILSWRRYFGGGTVSMLTVLHQPTVQRKEESLHEALEDGTLPFHSIIALRCAMDVHKKLYGAMSTISQHTLYLARRLYDGLTRLRHFNGQPVCIIHVDSKDTPFIDPRKQGATVSFNVLDPYGRYVEHSLVEKLANEKGIYVRSGGLCNPGGIAHHLKIEPWQFKRAWSSGYRCGGEVNSFEIIHGKPTGVVRASLGAMSTRADVDIFLAFMASSFVRQVSTYKAEHLRLVEGTARSLKHAEENYRRSIQVDSGFHSGSGRSTAQSSPCPDKMEARGRISVSDFVPVKQNYPKELVIENDPIDTSREPDTQQMLTNQDSGLQDIQNPQRWILQRHNNHKRMQSSDNQHNEGVEMPGSGFAFVSTTSSNINLVTKSKPSNRFRFWKIRKISPVKSFVKSIS